MNLAIVFGLAVGFLAAIWALQTALLWFDCAENPWRGLFRIKDASKFVRGSVAVIVQVVLVGFLIGYPLVIGQDPFSYHKAKILPPHPEYFVEALFVALSCFVVGIGGEMLAGWIRLSPHYGWAKSIRKVVEAILRPVPLACLEEGIYRGIVLEQMTIAFGPGRVETIAAICCSAVVFSALHFIRPARTPWPAIGLFVLGILLGIAYVVGGHSYWLPVGLHAGGVLAIKLLQPFVEYRGPGWVIGDRTYPIAGIVGIAVMVFLVVYVVARFRMP
jgi:hypothetical protein